MTLLVGIKKLLLLIPKFAKLEATQLPVISRYNYSTNNKNPETERSEKQNSQPLALTSPSV